MVTLHSLIETHPVGQECSLDTSKHGIENDAEGEQEASGWRGHSRETRDNSGTSSQQHSCYQNIGHKSKDSKDSMSWCAISSLNHLEERLLCLTYFVTVVFELDGTYVCVWCPSFQLNGNRCKEKNLYCSSTRIPEGARCAIFIRYRRGLKQGRRPCPRTVCWLSWVFWLWSRQLT